MSTERKPATQREIDWGKLIEEALTAPGSLGETYSRFYDYSFLNILYLRMQGVAEPVANYNRWKAIGRQVMKGQKAKEVIVPIKAMRENEEGEKVPVLVGFKSVAGVFGLSQTTGKALPPVPVPGWDAETALKALHIQRIPFDQVDGNMQGFSNGRELALNPVAVNPNKTLFHEIGHIVLGHTDHENPDRQAMHRGVAEFQAEATAYLALKELNRLDDNTASVSRAYIQHWLEDDRPNDKAIREVFAATDTILRAGRVAISASVGDITEDTIR